MKISTRLQAIADIVPNESKVIDVGCDHALLDIYLSLEKNCECIAADINENALEQAKYNIKRYGVKNIKTVLTDGLNNIEVNDNDIIVISGMGYTTIEHILTTNKTSNTLIISAHNDWDFLRRTVTKLGYKIITEKFVTDKKKHYIIIKFEKGEGKYSDIDLLYGPILKENKDYLNVLYNNTFEIYEKVPDDNINKDIMKKRLLEIQSLIEKL